MLAPSEPLEIRKPETTWMLGSICLCLFVYGLLWTLFSFVLGMTDPAHQTRQMILSALFWMICVLATWKAAVPKSRWVAFFNVMFSVLIIGVVGTVVAYVTLMSHGVNMGGAVLLPFFFLTGALLVAQLILALPVAALFQWLVLRRSAPESAEP